MTLPLHTVALAILTKDSSVPTDWFNIDYNEFNGIGLAIIV